MNIRNPKTYQEAFSEDEEVLLIRFLEKMDSKPSDFLNTFDKTITDVSKRFKVQEKELMDYFEKEMLSI
jgi:hypothetical protein